MIKVKDELSAVAKRTLNGSLGRPYYELDWWSDNEATVKKILEYNDADFSDSFNSDAYFSLMRNGSKYRTDAYLGLLKSYDVDHVNIEAFNKLVTYRYLDARINMRRNFRFAGSVDFSTFATLLTIFHHSDFQSKDKTLTRLFEKYYIGGTYRQNEFFYANFFINDTAYDEELKASAFEFLSLSRTASDESFLDALWGHHFRNVQFNDKEWASLFTHEPQSFLPFQIFYICGRLNIPLPAEMQAFSDLFKKIRLDYDDVTEKLEIMCAREGIR